MLVPTGQWVRQAANQPLLGRPIGRNSVDKHSWVGKKIKEATIILYLNKDDLLGHQENKKF